MLQGAINILINDAAVQNAVGRNSANDKYKVYPVSCPEPEDDPYIILGIVKGTIFTRCKTGSGNMDETPFYVNCYAKSYAKVDEIFEAIRAALDNYTSAASGIKFKRIYLDDFNDGWIKDQGDGLFVRESIFKAIIDVSSGP